MIIIIDVNKNNNIKIKIKIIVMLLMHQRKEISNKEIIILIIVDIFHLLKIINHFSKKIRINTIKNIKCKRKMMTKEIIRGKRRSDFKEAEAAIKLRFTNIGNHQ